MILESYRLGEYVVTQYGWSAYRKTEIDGSYILSGSADLDKELGILRMSPPQVWVECPCSWWEEFSAIQDRLDKWKTTRWAARWYNNEDYALIDTTAPNDHGSSSPEAKKIYDAVRKEARSRRNCDPWQVMPVQKPQHLLF